jgi:hypothetical protein
MKIDTVNKASNPFYIENETFVVEDKSLSFIKNIIEKHFTMPNEGSILQFGVLDGIALQRLCDVYGQHRVIGYELYPIVEHPCLVQLDCNTIGAEQKTPIAFCDLDVGNFVSQHQLRLKLLHWCAPQVVQGGMIMVNSPLVTEEYWEEQGHDYMLQNGFVCHRFSRYVNEPWAVKMQEDTHWNPKTWCLYQKTSEKEA